MKKSWFVFVFLVAIIFCCFMVISCEVRKGEAITGRTFTPANHRIAHGEILYMAYCNKCHPGGEAGIGPGLNSNPAPGFIKRFQMRHGLGVMPAFSHTELSHDDLKDIAKYLHAWKRY